MAVKGIQRAVPERTSGLPKACLTGVPPRPYIRDGQARTRMWRNWQTRRSQKPVMVTSWRFDPSHPHSQNLKGEPNQRLALLLFRMLIYQREYMVVVQLALSQYERDVHHRDTEDTEIAQRVECLSLCVLCALCVCGGESHHTLTLKTKLDPYYYFLPFSCGHYQSLIN
jgi:hypothetical protein